jgi:thioredoxin reductase (NADPH)
MSEPAGRPGGQVTGPAAETPGLQGAYPRLDDAQIAALAGLGQRRPVQPGEVLFREGDRDCDLFVILAGLVAVQEGRGTPEERIISVHGRGRFLGELNLLTGEAAFYTAVVTDTGEVLAVPASRVAGLVTADPALGDLILRACLARRSVLIGLGAGLRIIGSRYSPDVRRLRDFAARNRIPHRWLDLEADPAAGALLGQFRIDPADTPVVIAAGRLLRNPSNAELAAAIGLAVPAAAAARCDLLVVGAGPAGLSAAVYGASEGLATVVIDDIATGGQAGTSSRIENYLGFPAGISGADLADRAMLQARKFGAQWLSVPRAEHFEQTSIYYAASQAEALMCRGDPVAIVGGGNSAGQAAVFLSGQAAQVTLIVLEPDLTEYMSRYLIDQVTRLPNVQVLLRAEVAELLGDQALTAVVVRDNQTGARHTLGARALFVFIGVTPCTGWLRGLVDLDDHGFVRTGPAEAADGAPPPGYGRSALETSQPGIFAVGDVRSGSAKRVAAAVGEGAMAIRLALERLHPG